MVGGGQAIIYVNTRRKVDFLLDKMTSRDFTVSALVRAGPAPAARGGAKPLAPPGVVPQALPPSPPSRPLVSPALAPEIGSALGLARGSAAAPTKAAKAEARKVWTAPGGLVRAATPRTRIPTFDATSCLRAAPRDGVELGWCLVFCVCVWGWSGSAAARRHGPEGPRAHHARVPQRLLPRPHHHRLARPRCAPARRVWGGGACCLSRARSSRGARPRAALLSAWHALVGRRGLALDPRPPP